MRESEIQVSLRHLGIDDPRDTDELTPKFPPGIVALLAAISVTIAWTIWSPHSNRTIPFVISICQFVIVILGFAVFGGLLGTVINTFGNKRSVSECSIQVLRKPVVTEYAMPLEKRELVREIHDKTNSCDYAKILKTDTLIASLISNQNLLNWPSFRIIVDDETIDEETSARLVTPVDDDVEQQLIDYIQQHLEVEADPDSPEIVTLRFRCRYRLDASTFLANLVRKQISNLDLENEQVRQLASRGASLATETTAINWLSWPNSKPERWLGFDWQVFLQTANVGAISAIVFLSSIRVLAGVPPV